MYDIEVPMLRLTEAASVVTVSPRSNMGVTVNADKALLPIIHVHAKQEVAQVHVPNKQAVMVISTNKATALKTVENKIDLRLTRVACERADRGCLGCGNAFWR